MIAKLAELNRALASVEAIGGQGKADLGAVIEHCSRTVIEARMPDHEATLDFAKALDLVAIDGADVALTESGQGFLRLNPGRVFDLTIEQKRVLGRVCYLGNVLRKECKLFFAAFSFSQSVGAHRWSELDSARLDGPDWLATHLIEIGVLLPVDHGLTVAPAFATLVAAFIEESQGMSEERLREILKEKEEVGAFAEEHIRRFESDRLAAGGHVVESRCVRLVGRIRVNAGYDIESFDSSAPTLMYDRFVEVKGAKTKDLRFFWSDNEMKVAEALGDRYWIYFQGGINIKKRQASIPPVLYQDPMKSILNDGGLDRVPQGLIVSKRRS